LFKDLIPLSCLFLGLGCFSCVTKVEQCGSGGDDGQADNTVPRRSDDGGGGDQEEGGLVPSAALKVYEKQNGEAVREEWDGDGGGGAGRRWQWWRRSGTAWFPNVRMKAGRTVATSWTQRRRRRGGGRVGSNVEEEGAGNFGSLMASKSKSSG
jgi:hypothetical protein